MPTGTLQLQPPGQEDASDYHFVATKQTLPLIPDPDKELDPT